jgi:thiamine biosynthesis protein ThiS
MPVSFSVRINGSDARVAEGSSIADLVEQVVGPGTARGVAVARNGMVVPRSQWADAIVAPRDEFEIAAPFQGG